VPLFLYLPHRKADNKHKPQEETDERENRCLAGTLALMVLKTLEALGPLHGYGIARRIEQTSEHLPSIN
jgi:hypothetical protein